jgi:DNA-binding transcriptional regulator GbsR (MarR family)
MRREPIRDVLRILIHSPGQTNSDLSRALGLSESAMSEQMKMLCDRDITTKEKSSDGRVLFSVSPEIMAFIDRLHERLIQKGIDFSL